MFFTILQLPVIKLDSAPLPVTSMQSQLLEVTPKPTLEPSSSLILPTVRNTAANMSATIPPPPPVEKPLPQNWKEVKEPSGKVCYYYLTILKHEDDLIYSTKYKHHFIYMYRFITTTP